MKIILRNIVAFIVGAVCGSIANGSLIMISGHVIPPPAGVDVMQAESIAANIHLFEPKHFLFPFLAHALGTLVGAVIVALLAGSQQKNLALGIGALFLAGGVMAAFMIPAPAWFIAVDLLLAYVPMAWLGHLLVRKGRQSD